MVKTDKRKRARQIRRQQKQEGRIESPEPFLLEHQDGVVLGYVKGTHVVIKRSEGDIRSYDDLIQKAFPEGTIPANNDWKWYFGPKDVAKRAKQLYFNDKGYDWLLGSLNHAPHKDGRPATGMVNPEPSLVCLYKPKERSHIIGESTFTTPATKQGKRDYRVWNPLIFSEEQTSVDDKVEWSGATLANEKHNKFSYHAPPSTLHVPADQAEVKAKGIEDIIEYVNTMPGAQDVLIALQDRHFREEGIQPVHEERLQYSPRQGKVIDLRSQELAQKNKRHPMRSPWARYGGIPLSKKKF
ncbi:MAG: hypothetical protein ACLFO2_03830 [Candidatus Woesearchaeota archaeon]